MIKQPFFLRQIKKLSFELVLLLFIFMICLVVLLNVADMVFEDKSTVFDERIFSLVHPYINSSNTSLMTFFTFFGSPTFLLTANILLAGIFLFYKNHRWYSLKIAAISLTSTAVMFLLKSILQRQRPLLPVIAQVRGYSFPSGHSFSSLVFFGMLAYIIHRTVNNKLLKTILIIACFAFTFMIGFSRIYLKVHYASDVIAGFCLGAIWLVLARWLLIKTDKVVEEVSGVIEQPDRP